MLNSDVGAARHHTERGRRWDGDEGGLSAGRGVSKGKRGEKRAERKIMSDEQES
jgi:hypothetical protein